LLILLKGFLLGLSIAAPVGPIGILCIRKTLQQGRPMGSYPDWARQRQTLYTDRSRLSASPSYRNFC